VRRKVVLEFAVIKMGRRSERKKYMRDYFLEIMKGYPEKFLYL